MHMEECPVCKLAETQIDYQDAGERMVVDCGRCGAFTITEIAAGQLDKRTRPLLSAWIRERKEAHTSPPDINSKALPSIIRDLPDWGLRDKQRLLLQAIERRAENPSSTVGIDYVLDYPLAWASDEGELIYILQALHERGLTSGVSGGYRSEPGHPQKIHIRPAGWDYLDSLDKAAPFSRQVFVAMWFAEEMDSAWANGIQPTLRRLGYHPYRVDKDLSSFERIDAKIQAEIRKSTFMVADVTGQRNGVYFEAGYALGLGLPVIWSVREEELDKVHFDTRHFPHIVWATESELAEELEARIKAGIAPLRSAAPQSSM